MKILYICTHNRCRSILSEAITNHLGNGKLSAVSAGSQPVGEVHPLSIKYLQEKGIGTQALRSKSWDEFEQQQPDIVVTVCDSAANESCPVWFGSSIKIHWGLNDPSKLSGSEEQVRQAFYSTISIIEQRVHRLLELDVEDLTREELQAALNALSKEF